PACHLRALRTLMPAPAAAASCVLPSISFLRSTLTCPSVTMELLPAPFHGFAARTATTGKSNCRPRRIDSRFLLPSEYRLPHVDCYPTSARLSGGGGGDGEATEHGDTARAEAGGWRTLSGGRQVGTPPDPRRIHAGYRLPSQAQALRVLHRPFEPRPARARK